MQIQAAFANEPSRTYQVMWVKEAEAEAFDDALDQYLNNPPKTRAPNPDGALPCGLLLEAWSKDGVLLYKGKQLRCTDARGFMEKSLGQVARREAAYAEAASDTEYRYSIQLSRLREQYGAAVEPDGPTGACFLRLLREQPIFTDAAFDIYGLSISLGIACTGDPKAQQKRLRRMEELDRAAAWIVRTGSNDTLINSHWVMFGDLYRATGVDVRRSEAEQQYLNDRLERMTGVRAVFLQDDHIEVSFHTEACPRMLGRFKEPIMLRELLRTKWDDVSLCLAGSGKASIPISLGYRKLSEVGALEWADVLNGIVERVRQGPQGLEIRVSGVEEERLERFSSLMAGGCEEERLWLEPSHQQKTKAAGRKTGGKAAEKGWVVKAVTNSELYIPHARHIQRNRDLEDCPFETDAQAARAAEQDGVELIYGMRMVADGVYLDTPENREVIQESLQKYVGFTGSNQWYNEAQKAQRRMEDSAEGQQMT